MKKLILLIVSIVSVNAFSAGCEEYSYSAIACYEKGALMSNYDETGDECGNGDNFWEIAPSTNSTISTTVEYDVVEGYMGGKSWNSECHTSFVNEAGEHCSFIINTSLGTEDAEIDIIDFKCR